MKMTPKSGTAIAAAAAALILSGGIAMTPASAEEGKVHCFGVNACKGHGSCKTSMNECKGMNSCKGHGWVEKTAAECKAEGGSETEMKK